jgi:hypothetical protein
MQKSIAIFNHPQDKKILIEQVLDALNYVSNSTKLYVGGIITAKYWNQTRPDSDWCGLFAINSSAEIAFAGSSQEIVNDFKLQLIKVWIINFIKACSVIVSELSLLLDLEKLLFNKEKETKNNPENQKKLAVVPSLEKTNLLLTDEKSLTATKLNQEPIDLDRIVNQLKNQSQNSYVKYFTKEEIKIRGGIKLNDCQMIFQNKTFRRGMDFSKNIIEKVINYCEDYNQQNTEILLIDHHFYLTFWIEILPKKKA